MMCGQDQDRSIRIGERYDLPAAVSSLYTILGITMIDPEIPLFISILSRLSNLEEILEKRSDLITFSFRNMIIST